MKGIDHQSNLLEMVVIFLDSMPIFGAVTASFQSCQPSNMPQIGNFYKALNSSVKVLYGKCNNWTW